MSTLLFRSAPVRTRRTLLTLLASVAVHGLTVAAASFWVVRPAIPLPLPPTQLILLPSPDGPQLENLPVSTPAFAPPPTILPEPPAPDDPLTPNPPPPAIDPDLTEPPAPTVPPPLRRAHRLTPTARSVPGSSTPGRAGSTIHESSAPGSRAASVVSADHPGSGGAWKTSKPPYPYALRAARVQGSGNVRVTTDPAGHVIQAAVSQSSGSTALDDNICRYARTFWSGPPDSTTTVPFTYRLP